MYEPIPSIEFAKKSYPHLYAACEVEIHQLEGIRYIESGAPSFLLNGVVDLPNSIDEKSIDEIESHYKKLSLPYSWITVDSEEPPELTHYLKKRGIHPIGQFPYMGIDVETAQNPAVKPELKIQQITTEKELEAWLETLCAAWEFQEPTLSIFQKLFKKAGLKKDFVHYVGIKEGRVVTTGSLLTTHHGAYIFNAGTLQEERNHGYSRQLIYQLIQHAKKSGVKRCALVSNPPALTLWQSLGFTTLGNHNFYTKT